MFHKQEFKKELVNLVEHRKISKTEANRRYIREMNGKLEHVYRGELPFPSMSGQIKSEVLAIVGQVMYLYTQDWKKGV